MKFLKSEETGEMKKQALKANFEKWTLKGRRVLSAHSYRVYKYSSHGTKLAVLLTFLQIYR